MNDSVDLMASADVARLFGVTPGAVGNWRMKGHFIEPAMRVGNRDLFRTTDVEAWGRRTGRLPYRPQRLYDWQGYDVTDDYVKRAA